MNEAHQSSDMQDEGGPEGGFPDLDGFMRLIMQQRQGAKGQDRAAAEASGQQASGLRRDYETSLHLLGRASDAVPTLMRRCEGLEAALEQTRHQSLVDLDAANGVAEQWHHLALALKDKLKETEGEMAGLRQRLAGVEADLTTERRRAAEAERQADLALEVTTMFHDKIVEAFGVGSQAHQALDLVAKGVVERASKPTLVANGGALTTPQ